jgi:zinc transport system permease protein
MFSLAFMQRALLAGLILAALLSALGIFVSVRRMAFFGEGIAHSSLAGIAIAVLGGLAPLPTALAWGVAAALVIRRLERSTRLPSDSLIGVIFTASMALGVVLMSLHRGYQPELISFLFGSILSVSATDLAVMAAIAGGVGLWLFVSFRELTYLSLSEDSARVAGIKVDRQTDFLYLALALGTVLGVKILGIVLVSALLIIPPATARLLTRSFRGYLLVAVALALAAVLAGLVASDFHDLPSGAAIVLASSAMFAIAAARRLVKFKRPTAPAG